ncbi:Hypothetical protein R9X50_00741000 [Acrodontium crateriforme]|uniref:Uncharacterized protein n=1 Tax=Acrodontium crateriforme TaxID=150365 RepID=A0AAQ3MBT1_9PEZI|nr:Hypothetical protein R9X50_00741000 [Acrodontium crateriforme]
MALWPFSKKSRSSAKDPGPQPVRAASLPEPPDMAMSKQKDPARKLRRTSWRNFHSDTKKKTADSPGKENIPPPRGSVEENITALPNSRALDSSPHLRPVDLARPAVSYNFRQNTDSQASFAREEPHLSHSRPGTVRSRRSGIDRQTSSRRRKDEKIREEEIRAMSAPIPIPKRQGEGILRKDSKKVRSIGARGSTISLPPEDSIHSSMSASQEQRGWEVGLLDVFNPRPAVRLSITPQHILPQTSMAASYIIHEDEEPFFEKQKEMEKRPMTRESRRRKKRDIIGDHADELSASELRLLMERDAMRREQREQEKREKLDRKLRARAGRQRADTGKKSVDSEELKEELARERAQQEAIKRAEELEMKHADTGQQSTPRSIDLRRQLTDEEIARRLMTPPTAVHPALRDSPFVPESETTGLGIEEPQHVFSDPAEAHVETTPTKSVQGVPNTGTYVKYSTSGDIYENPSEDTLPPRSDRGLTPITPAAFSTLETPIEEPVLETAQAVRLSQSLHVITSNMPSEPEHNEAPTVAQPVNVPDKHKELPSDPPKERRAGAWASFFRRGTIRKTTEAPPSQGSFSNASRESMRNQPLPAHLVDTAASNAFERRSSGTPVRTMSKFREDLPELPISPPDSRTQSPDVMAMAAALAAARRPQRTSRQFSQEGISARMSGVDPETEAGATREGVVPASTESPISPGSHRRGLVSASLASIDSEGSWLASGGSVKRQSTQSGVRRSMGSLRNRRAEFASSYEELGGDKDAEYVQSANREAGREFGSPGLLDASLDEASEYDTAPVSPEIVQAEPLAIHGSVRRKPTLVHRDQRIKSREGLLTDFTTAEHKATLHDLSSPNTPTAGRLDSDTEPESPAPQLHNATSVNYGRGHARHVSAGSAVLLQMPKRASADVEKLKSQAQSSVSAPKSAPLQTPESWKSMASTEE